MFLIVVKNAATYVEFLRWISKRIMELWKKSFLWNNLPIKSRLNHRLSTDGKIYAYQSERTVKIFKCKDFFVENYIFNETMEKRPINRRISIRWYFLIDISFYPISFEISYDEEISFPSSSVRRIFIPSHNGQPQPLPRRTFRQCAGTLNDVSAKFFPEHRECPLQLSRWQINSTRSCTFAGDVRRGPHPSFLIKCSPPSPHFFRLFPLSFIPSIYFLVPFD